MNLGDSETGGAWKWCADHWEDCESVPLSDRGFRYGMSIFETVGILRGKPLFASEHLGRLRFGGFCEGETLPDCGAGTGVLRVYVTAGPGRPGDAFGGAVFGIFEACEVGTDFAAARVGVSAAIYLPRPGGLKTGNYWQNVDAWVVARDAGLDEGLLFNPSGHLVSASMANVFLQSESGWITPALETGARAGVVREWVQRQLGAEEGIFGIEEVGRCTGGFLTNSRIGLREICEIDGRPVASEIGPLREAYRRVISS